MVVSRTGFMKDGTACAVNVCRYWKHPAQKLDDMAKQEYKDKQL
jgi:hypothetical protein